VPHPLMLPPFNDDPSLVEPSSASVSSWTAHKLARWRTAMEATARMDDGDLSLARDPLLSMEVWLRPLRRVQSQGRSECVSGDWIRIERSEEHALR